MRTNVSDPYHIYVRLKPFILNYIDLWDFIAKYINNKHQITSSYVKEILGECNYTISTLK